MIYTFVFSPVYKVMTWVNITSYVFILAFLALLLITYSVGVLITKIKLKYP